MVLTFDQQQSLDQCCRRAVHYWLRDCFRYQGLSFTDEEIQEFADVAYKKHEGVCKRTGLKLPLPVSLSNHAPMGMRVARIDSLQPWSPTNMEWIWMPTREPVKQRQLIKHQKWVTELRAFGWFCSPPGVKIEPVDLPEPTLDEGT